MIVLEWPSPVSIASLIVIDMHHHLRCVWKSTRRKGTTTLMFKQTLSSRRQRVLLRGLIPVDCKKAKNEATEEFRTAY